MTQPPHSGGSFIRTRLRHHHFGRFYACFLPAKLDYPTGTPFGKGASVSTVNGKDRPRQRSSWRWVAFATPVLLSLGWAGYVVTNGVQDSEKAPPPTVTTATPSPGAPAGRYADGFPGAPGKVRVERPDVLAIDISPQAFDRTGRYILGTRGSELVFLDRQGAATTIRPPEAGKQRWRTEDVELSADGSTIAFVQSETTGQKSRIFTCPTPCAKPVELPLTLDGGPDDVISFAISGNGQRLAISTSARLAPEDTDKLPDIYLLELATSAVVGVTLADVNPHLPPSDSMGASYPHLNGDGTVLAYEVDSYGKEVTSPTSSVVTWNKADGRTELITGGKDGRIPPSTSSYISDLSDSGRFLLFDSEVMLDAKPGPADAGIYVKDLHTGALVAVPLAGACAGKEVQDSLVSDDGRLVTTECSVKVEKLSDFEQFDLVTRITVQDLATGTGLDVPLADPVSPGSEISPLEMFGPGYTLMYLSRVRDAYGQVSDTRYHLARLQTD